MTRLNSFYLAPASWREPFVLEGEEAHHLTRVLRTKTGETIRLFDGHGRSGLFRVENLGKRDVQVARLHEECTPPPTHPLTLAVGWTKGIRRGYLLEKAVELGAAAVWFWRSSRSQGTISDTGQEAWERQLVAAAKQCGTARLPVIRVFSKPEDIIHSASGFGSRILCWEQEHATILAPSMTIHSQGAIAVLGPEGGLLAAEAQLFMDAGFLPCSLGPSILRFETAGIYVLSLHHFAAMTASD